MIFKNIPQNKKESWEEAKSILANDLHKFMPQFQLEYITSKMEKANRSRETKFTKVPAIIAKFSDWSIMEMIKNSLNLRFPDVFSSSYHLQKLSNFN